MLSTLRRTGATLAVAAAGLLASAGAAHAGMTIELGRPDVSGRVLVDVPVTVTCSPFDSTLVLAQSHVSVTVEQAAGQRIARGSRMTFNALPACDGTPHTIGVSILADAAGAPFHGGPAVFSASAGAFAGTPCPFWPGCFTSPFASQSASVVAVLNMH